MKTSRNHITSVCSTRRTSTCRHWSNPLIIMTFSVFLQLRITCSDKTSSLQYSRPVRASVFTVPSKDGSYIFFFGAFHSTEGKLTFKGMGFRSTSKLMKTGRWCLLFRQMDLVRPMGQMCRDLHLRAFTWMAKHNILPLHLCRSNSPSLTVGVYAVLTYVQS